MEESIFEPLRDMIVTIAEVTEATKQGILLPDSVKDEKKNLVVIEVGPDVVSLKVGDRVLPPFHAMAMRGVEHEGVTYYITDEKSIPVKVL